MQTRPNLDPDQLRQTLQTAYALVVDNLVFTPGGEDGWAFRVTCPDGSRHHLKIYAQAPASLDIVDALRHTYGFTSAVSPLRTTDGQLSICSGDYVLALYPFIAGATMQASPFDERHLRELGRLLAQLHGTRLAVECPHEDFALRNREAFLRVIHHLPAAAHADNPYHRALADMLLPCRERLLAELIRFEEAARRARAAQAPFVLCHGDPTAGNILLAEQIYLIDWDGVLRAPKERDLVFFAGSQHESVRQGYAEVAGAAALDERIAAFYHAEWNIQEIADFGTRLLFETHDETHNEALDEQAAHDLWRVEDFLRYSGLGG